MIKFLRNVVGITRCVWWLFNLQFQQTSGAYAWRINEMRYITLPNEFVWKDLLEIKKPFFKNMVISMLWRILSVSEFNAGLSLFSLCNINSYLLCIHIFYLDKRINAATLKLHSTSRNPISALKIHFAAGAIIRVHNKGDATQFLCSRKAIGGALSNLPQMPVTVKIPSFVRQMHSADDVLRMERFKNEPFFFEPASDQDCCRCNQPVLFSSYTRGAQNNDVDRVFSKFFIQFALSLFNHRIYLSNSSLLIFVQLVDWFVQMPQ